MHRDNRSGQEVSQSVIHVKTVPNLPQINEEARHVEGNTQHAQHDQRATNSHDRKTYKRRYPFETLGFVDVPVVRHQRKRDYAACKHDESRKRTESRNSATQYDGDQNAGGNGIKSAESIAPY